MNSHRVHEVKLIRITAPNPTVHLFIFFILLLLLDLGRPNFCHVCVRSLLCRIRHPRVLRAVNYFLCPAHRTIGHVRHVLNSETGHTIPSLKIRWTNQVLSQSVQVRSAAPSSRDRDLRPWDSSGDRIKEGITSEATDRKAWTVRPYNPGELGLGQRE